MDGMASFGYWVRRRRKALDLTQEQLAQQVGCAEVTIKKIEADERRPSRQIAERLADSLQLAPAERAAFVQAARGELAADRLDLSVPPTTPEAAPLPGGTTTFLFTDIEGSTELWDQHPLAMPAALQRHELLLRQAIAEHRGVVFKTVGDALCAVFASALDALAAALAAQWALQAEPWETAGPLRVRMALYTGVVEERDGDYVGPPLNRVARLLAAAHGGQILLSRASTELVADGLPAGVSVRDLGTHQLKGLRRPEQIFQLVGPDLPSEFPPLRTLAAQPTNPPAPASPLLTTKLYVPPPRPNLVPRPRLIERLQAGMPGKLTLLAAPAGFGKTTLLSEWLALLSAEFSVLSAEVAQSAQLNTQHATRNTSVAWVSLDAGDNDPTRFWSYVCAALETLLPGVAERALALLQSSQPPPAETLLPSLLNAVSARAADCLLVLDDYHLITTPAIQQALAFLIDHLPPMLHLVIASREDPPLPLARLRARGQLLELRASELRFTPEEAATFLTEVMGLPLSPEDVAALEVRTEGWIAGLQLAALAMRERRNLAGFISAFTGSQRFVGEYLAEEVFARQPAHIQTFLLQTAILNRMCGPLCDAVLLGGAGAASPAPYPAASGDSFSQVVLEQLERANLFVVPLDDAQRWYRYHHLFGEMLCARLLRGASEAEVATLHRRASVWYEGQGLVVEAGQHALAAQDWERAGRMIEEHGLRLMMSGQVQTVLGWLGALPVAVVQLRPALCLIYANALMLTNQLDAAEGRLQDAERSLTPETPSDLARLVRGRVALVRGLICNLAGDLAQAISWVQQAVALLPETTTNVTVRIMSARTRATAEVVAATVYQLTGDVTAASERRVADAIGPVRATSNLMGTLHSYTGLAYLEVLQGRLRPATVTYTAVEQLFSGQAGLQAIVDGPAYYFGMGDLRREWNDLDAAEGYLAPGMELVQGGLGINADMIMRGHLAQAWLQQARGQGRAALETLDAFMQLARERQFFPLLIEQAAALRAHLQLLQGDLGAALRWADGSGLSPDDAPSFPREAAHLTLARVCIAAGQAQAVLPLLDRLLADAEAKARMHSAIEILSLQALAYDALNDRPRALTALERALVLAEPEGYIRTFVDEGTPMQVLLAECSGPLAAREGTAGRAGAARMLVYIETLLAAFPDDGRTTEDQAKLLGDDSR